MHDEFVIKLTHLANRAAEIRQNELEESQKAFNRATALFRNLIVPRFSAAEQIFVGIGTGASVTSNNTLSKNELPSASLVISDQKTQSSVTLKYAPEKQAISVARVYRGASHGEGSAPLSHLDEKFVEEEVTNLVKDHFKLLG